MYKKIILILFTLLTYISNAQLDIPYVFLHTKHNDTIINRGSLDVFTNMVSLDAKSVGMGKTQMIMREDFNGMWQNPAFLYKKKIQIELTNAQFVVPENTIKAVQFIMNNEANLITGKIIDDISLGLNKIITGTTTKERQEGVDIYNNAVEFVDKLINEFSGQRGNQMIHGISIYPKFQAQYKNFGFSLYNSTNMAFAIVPRELFRKFSEFRMPNNVDNIDEEELIDLAEEILMSIDSEGKVKPQALPAIYAFSLLDIVFATGYGYSINDKFKVGINLKIVNRRSNTLLIDFGNVDYINNHIGKGIIKPIWSGTIDIGGLYIDKKTGWAVSTVFKNIIPTTNDISSITESFVKSSINIPADSDGNKYIGRVEDNQFISDPNGDTLVYSDIQNITYINTFVLKTPFLFNVGVNKRFNDNLDLSFDIVDIFMKDDVYGKFYNRIRLGGEYRFFKNIFAIRAGVSEVYPTLGFGTNINVKNFLLQFDLAYSYNNLTDSPGYFFQIKLGYLKNTD